jgi:hypothetical protein
VTAALYAVLLAFHFSIDFRTATKSVYSSPHAVADTQTRADGITIPDPRRGAAVQWRELAAELGMKERRWQAKGALE